MFGNDTLDHLVWRSLEFLAWSRAEKYRSTMIYSGGKNDPMLFNAQRKILYSVHFSPALPLSTAQK